jgi:hypothetical protein
MTGRQTVKQSNKQADRQTDRKAYRQADRHDRQPDGKTNRQMQMKQLFIIVGKRKFPPSTGCEPAFEPVNVDYFTTASPKLRIGVFQNVLI